jgi:hypothetical protein
MEINVRLLVVFEQSARIDRLRGRKRRGGRHGVIARRRPDLVLQMEVAPGLL